MTHEQCFGLNRVESARAARYYCYSNQPQGQSDSNLRSACNKMYTNIIHAATAVDSHTHATNASS